MKSLAAIGTERQALLKRERELIASLNAVLPDIGYRVVPLTDGQPSRSPQKRPTRAVSPKALSCPHCGRAFALPLHLGRHMSVMHKVKKAAASKPTSTNHRTPLAAPAVPRSRRRMSPASRRAAARRMKAYRKRRKATAASKSSSPPRT